MGEEVKSISKEARDHLVTGFFVISSEDWNDPMMLKERRLPCEQPSVNVG